MRITFLTVAVLAAACVLGQRMVKTLRSVRKSCKFSIALSAVGIWT